MGLLASIPELFANSVELYGSRTLVSVDDHAVSFAEFAARVRLAAAALRAAGVQAGDRVVLLMPNSVDGLALLVGAMQLGALPAPINVRFGVLELNHILQELEPRVIVVTELAWRKSKASELGYPGAVGAELPLPLGSTDVRGVPGRSLSLTERIWRFLRNRASRVSAARVSTPQPFDCCVRTFVRQRGFEDERCRYV